MSQKHLVPLTAAAACVVVQTMAFGIGPSFRPDGAIKGSTLAGWHTVGSADWKALNGEVVCSPWICSNAISL